MPHDYSNSALSLIVPLLTIFMVLLTKRVAPSLLVGILAGGFLLFYDAPLNALIYSYNKISGVFYSVEGGKITLAMDSFFVFGFLILLGILTQIIAKSGAIGAFVAWAHRRVKTAQGSEFVAFIAGIIIFVDDYFNALSVGQISKQLNDANRSSRERLAYIIDSTSAPICILVPISSWGAYIIGVMDESVPRAMGDGLVLLSSSVASNFYAWFALLAVFLSIFWRINLAPMRKNVNVGVVDLLENRGESAGVGADSSADSNKLGAKMDSNKLGAKNDVANAKTPSIWLLITPILTLMLAIFALIFGTGYLAGGRDIISMLSNTQTALSLFVGGAIAVALSAVLSARHLRISDTLPIIKNGFNAMLPAIIILILAWAIGPIIRDDMATGAYLAGVAKSALSSDALAFMPAALFVISAFIAFATGTSWGTFAIMIPIGVGLVGAFSGMDTLGAVGNLGADSIAAVGNLIEDSTAVAGNLTGDSIAGAGNLIADSAIGNIAANSVALTGNLALDSATAVGNLVGDSIAGVGDLIADSAVGNVTANSVALTGNFAGDSVVANASVGNLIANSAVGNVTANSVALTGKLAGDSIAVAGNLNGDSVAVVGHLAVDSKSASSAVDSIENPFGSPSAALSICFGAILGGAVFGDHASPISDTTILSATGAGCSVESHFITQLPYVLSVFAVALLAFVVLGVSYSLLAAYAAGLLALLALFYTYARHFSGELEFK